MKINPQDLVDKMTKQSLRRERVLMIALTVFFGLLLLALVLFAARAEADDLIRWQHPTSRTNGVPLLLSEIQGTLIRARDIDASPGTATRFTIPAPDNMTTVPRDPLAVGTVCYSAATIDLAGLMSDFTGEVCKSNDGPAPGPASSPPGAPSGFTVESVS